MTSAAALVLKKEWKESFNSPMPYVFLVIFFALMGWFFFAALFLLRQATMQDFLAPLTLILTFFIPAFTMRLFSEEYKTGTIETLATLPIRDTDIVLGKFLAAAAIWGFTLILSLFYLALILVLGKPDLGQSLAGLLGAFLLGTFYSSLGLFASSLTRSQVVGFILGFIFCFSLFLCGKFAESVAGIPGILMTFFGVDSHYESFLRGVVDSRDVVYFISGQALFLAATLTSYNSRRWR